MRKTQSAKRKAQNDNSKFKIFVFFITFSFALLTFHLSEASAGPVSTSFELKEYGFGAGGTQNSDSTTYSMFGVAGEVESGNPVSTTYQLGEGLIYTMQANVPPAPDLTNPANWYNKLKLIIATGNNPTDSEFSIAISTDAFVGDTKYVQTDHTPGASPVWQIYSAWGGASGFNVIGLLPNQTYTVKVSARQGNYTQVQYGPTDNAATVYPSITFSITGVAAGTAIDGMTTDITTTDTDVTYGELPMNTPQEAASLLTVTTTADLGYTVTTLQSDDLQTYNNIVFPRVSGTNAVPTGWPVSVATGAYGYHTSDHALGTGDTTRFTPVNTFARFEATPREVAYNGGPINPDTTYVVYSIETGPGQPAGSYSHTLTYIATGVF